MTKGKSFSAEFKREAVRLMEGSGKLPPDLAREVGKDYIGSIPMTLFFDSSDESNSEQ